MHLLFYAIISLSEACIYKIDWVCWWFGDSLYTIIILIQWVKINNYWLRTNYWLSTSKKSIHFISCVYIWITTCNCVNIINWGNSGWLLTTISMFFTITIWARVLDIYITLHVVVILIQNSKDLSSYMINYWNFSVSIINICVSFRRNLSHNTTFSDSAHA